MSSREAVVVASVTLTSAVTAEGSSAMVLPSSALAMMSWAQLGTCAPAPEEVVGDDVAVGAMAAGCVVVSVGAATDEEVPPCEGVVAGASVGAAVGVEVCPGVVVAAPDDGAAAGADGVAGFPVVVPASDDAAAPVVADASASALAGVTAGADVARAASVV
mmetsp:Transcript_8371/g.26281  ORF Transcript_8371/g.26281 Transcript_8371/m.26281 type:complete len:161 (+) Transcript_8371:374-856(+)